MPTHLSAIVRRVILAEAISSSSLKATLPQAVRKSAKSTPISDEQVAEAVRAITEGVDALRVALEPIVREQMKGSSESKIASKLDNYAVMGSQWAIRQTLSQTDQILSLGDESVYAHFARKIRLFTRDLPRYYSLIKSLPPEAANIMAIRSNSGLLNYIRKAEDADPNWGIETFTDPTGRYRIRVAHTFASMCEMGKNSDWCVAKKPRHFDLYNKAGNPSVVVTDARTNEDFICNFSTLEFQNKHQQEIPVEKIREIIDALQRSNFFHEYPDAMRGVEMLDLRHTADRAVISKAVDDIFSAADRPVPDQETYKKNKGVLLNPNLTNRQAEHLAHLHSLRPDLARNESERVARISAVEETDRPFGIYRNEFFRFRPNPVAYDVVLSHLRAERRPYNQLLVYVPMIRASSHLPPDLQEKVVRQSIEDMSRPEAADHSKDFLFDLVKDPMNLISLGDILRNLSPSPKNLLIEHILKNIPKIIYENDFNDVKSAISLMNETYRHANRVQLLRIQDDLATIEQNFRTPEELRDQAKQTSSNILTMLHSRQSRDGRRQKDDVIIFIIQQLDIHFRRVLDTLIDGWSDRTLSAQHFQREYADGCLAQDFLSWPMFENINEKMRSAYDRSEIKKRLGVPLSEKWIGYYIQSWLYEFFREHTGVAPEKIPSSTITTASPSSGAELVVQGGEAIVKFTVHPEAHRSAIDRA